MLDYTQERKPLKRNDWKPKKNTAIRSEAIIIMCPSNTQQLKAIKEKYKKHLFTFPNVEAIGIGPKISKGNSTGEMAIKIFVRQKIPIKELTDEETIPEELDGFPTDVEELAPLHAQ